MKTNIRTQVQSDATKAIKDSIYKGIVHVSPRVGKTKLTIDALNLLSKELKVLILAPKKEIFKSWKEEIIKWKLKENFTITYCWSNALKKDKEFYDLIIADEIHEYNDKVLIELQKKQYKGSRILALTGTLDPITEISIQKILGLSTIYEYSIHQAIKDEIIADYEIICIATTLDNENKTIIAGSENNRFYQTEAVAYEYWNSRYINAVENKQWSSLKFLMSKRLNLIYNSVNKIKETQQLCSKTDRCIVFTGRQEVANNVTKHSFHSKSNEDNLTKFKKGVINKLSVVSMVSMGITIPNLKIAIFNQLKSGENLAVQQAMRVMNMEDSRKATIYVIYVKATQDEVWLRKALNGFDKNKIIFI